MTIADITKIWEEIFGRLRNNESLETMMQDLCQSCQHFGGAIDSRINPRYRCWQGDSDHPSVKIGIPQFCEFFEFDFQEKREKDKKLTKQEIDTIIKCLDFDKADSKPGSAGNGEFESEEDVLILARNKLISLYD
jgi:hypothetical protein